MLNNFSDIGVKVRIIPRLGRVRRAENHSVTGQIQFGRLLSNGKTLTCIIIDYVRCALRGRYNNPRVFLFSFMSKTLFLGIKPHTAIPHQAIQHLSKKTFI